MATLTLATVPVTGERIDLTFSGAVTGVYSTDFVVTADGGSVPLLVATGSGVSWSLPVDSAFLSNIQTVKVSYIGTVVAPVTLTAGNSSTITEAIRKYQTKRFGAFITWGGLTWPAEAGNAANQSNVNSYFNPTSYSMDNFLDGVQAMGCKYVIFTAKHGGALCLWPTLSGAPNIGPTPWYASTHTDIVLDYVTKCRARKLGVGIYLNWYDPYYTTTRVGQNGTYTNTSPTYLAYISQQITELLTNYGPIDYFWIDALGYSIGYTVSPWSSILSLIRGIQPNCVIINNDHTGDLTHSDIAVWEGDGVQAETPSNNILPGEFTEASNSTDFSYVWHVATENTYLTLAYTSQTLRRLNGKHANYLLNITPNTSGVLPTAQTAFCVALGNTINTMSDWFKDTFRGAAGSLNSAHSVDYGAASVTPFNGDQFLDGLGFIYTNPGAPGYALYHVTPPSADYAIEQTLILKDINTDQLITLSSRITPTGDRYDFNYLGASGGAFSLQCYVSGSPTTIVTGVEFTPVAGQLYTLRLECNGTTITAYKDGVSILSGTNNQIASAGWIGYNMAGAVTPTTGPRMGTLRAFPIGGASAPLTLGNLTVVAGTTMAVLTGAGAVGGIPPYTYQYYRSAVNGFTPGPSNLLAGATGVNLTDTPLTPGTIYYYQQKATDASGVVVFSPQLLAVTLASTGTGRASVPAGQLLLSAPNDSSQVSTYKLVYNLWLSVSLSGYTGRKPFQSDSTAVLLSKGVDITAFMGIL